ncbi:tetratricopeptide repeat protein [Alphaproteobacteria bacterium]|nr:tetratricopeptide repeat protein [Alphaproteobacteria bacterium]
MNFSKAKFVSEKGEIFVTETINQTLLKSNSKNLPKKQFLPNLEDNYPVNKVINELIELYNQAEYKKVVEISQKYLKLYPSNEFIYNFSGVGNLALGNDHKALKAFKKAISLKPNFVDGYNNCGVALEKLNCLDQAVNAYYKAISINSNFFQAYNNIGNILRKKGDFNNAIDFFHRAISLKSDYLDAHSNLAIILQEKGKTSEAIQAYKKVLSLKPGCPSTLNGLGNAFKDQENYQEAIDMYSKAISLDNGFELAKAQKLNMLACICDWKSIKKDSLLLTNLGLNKKFVPPFTLLPFDDNPKRHQKRSENFSKLVFLFKPMPFKTRPFNSNKRIKIGYFSADFHDHATMYLISKIFALHDRSKFEIYAYSIGPKKDDFMRQNLIRSVDIFDDVSQMSDKDIAMLARQDEIDIAIDLKGYTHRSRTGIFAYRAAPIQINYLGYPGTMGVDFIDYIIADKIIIPEEYKNYYSEEIIYMPHSYQPNDNSRQISKKEITKSDMELPEDSFVFCSFNNSYKITPREFDIWMRIIMKVKGSVLWLLKSNQWVEDNLKIEAKKRGIDPSRLIFADKLPHAEHLARHRLADLFLDTFNVNAHTTASDALWAGLPVVTKLGKGFAARVAGSLLNAIDLQELITKNEKDYEKLILELALKPVKLNKIKNKLHKNRLSSPLFDTEKYTMHLENGYQKVFQNYINRRRPKTINIKS